MASKTKPARQGIMATVLGRMSASETLISDRHTDSMLMGLLAEAEKVEDGDKAAEDVRVEMASAWGVDDSDVEGRKPFLYRDGVAVIPVHGILINRFPYCWGFVTGYEFIRKQMNLAEADPDVKLIVFDHDTPGGEAAGCDELAREINELATPTMALVNTLSASGGFWLAAPCNRIVCAPSGSVGSIGVYILHINYEKMFADYGIEFDYIQAGAYKTAGSPYRSLSKSDRQYLQDAVDERYDEFVKAVAEFRGIDEGVARGTEARVMRPSEAISLGLIDAALAPAKAVAEFVAELGTAGESDDDEQEDASIMADQEMSSEQTAAARKAEQTRIKGIMQSAEAEGRTELAEHFAYDTEMSVEAATAALAKAPKAEAEKTDDGDKGGSGGSSDNGGAADEGSTDDKGNKDTGKENKDGDDTRQSGSESDDKDEKGDQAKGKSQFEQAMDQGNQPDVGGNGPGGDQSKVDRILAAQAAATGRKLPKA